VIPDIGGTYIEGSVGELQPLIPWFTVTNDVNRDIVSLVFSGLLKYNPVTKRIEDDLASYSVSDAGRIYTVKLNDSLMWHDSTAENPHPVTADDIVFTFKSIQDPEFPNALLRQNFLGVVIDKLDEKTVRFKLEEPYSFFASNLTIGLLPQKLFEGIPVSKFDQVLDFGFAPVGAGPYMFKSLVQTELSTEVTLERFERPLEPEYRLNRVVFRIFPDYSTLLSDIRNLDGVRLVPRNSAGDPILPRRFSARNYSLPQYVSLFLNLDRPILQDRNLRLGLQLGTNKQGIVDTINESLIVDTPLLEIDTSDWRYQYDPNSAQGALFESDWHLPEKLRLQRLLEMRDTNTVGPLKIDHIVLLDTGAVLTVTGSLTTSGLGSTVNGIPVVLNPSNTGSWIVALPTHGGTGSLILGDNFVQLINEKGETVDSCFVWRTSSTKKFKLASAEQDLLELFLKSREGEVSEDETITVKEMYFEKGHVRKRLTTDPTDIRMNVHGDRLTLTLVTSNAPHEYKKIAEELQEQWKKLGVHVGIVIPESREEFEDRLLKREYDILLFGQSLLDNLDSYPYWHSAGKQNLEGTTHELKIDSYNLSQYTSLEADTLLEVIRQTDNEDERLVSLNDLREVLKNDVPAIFLYSPLYTFAHHQDIRGVDLGSLSLHSDRFLTLHNWYLKETRIFKPNRGWLSFFGWIFSL